MWSCGGRCQGKWGGSEVDEPGWPQWLVCYTLYAISTLHIPDSRLQSVHNTFKPPVAVVTGLVSPYSNPPASTTASRVSLSAQSRLRFSVDSTSAAFEIAALHRVHAISVPASVLIAFTELPAPPIRTATSPRSKTRRPSGSLRRAHLKRCLQHNTPHLAHAPAPVRRGAATVTRIHRAQPHSLARSPVITGALRGVVVRG